MEKQTVLSIHSFVICWILIVLFAFAVLIMEQKPVKIEAESTVDISQYRFQEPHGIYDYVTPTVSVAPEKVTRQAPAKKPAKVAQKKPAKVAVGQSSKWRSEVRRQLKAQHVWSQSRENTVVRIIARESTGHENARNGDCVGLLQFNNEWKHTSSKSWFSSHKLGAFHKDNRLSGPWSIRRIAVVYRDGGDKAVEQHWSQTY